MVRLLLSVWLTLHRLLVIALVRRCSLALCPRICEKTNRMSWINECRYIPSNTFHQYQKNDSLIYLTRLSSVPDDPYNTFGLCHLCGLPIQEASSLWGDPDWTSSTNHQTVAKRSWTNFARPCWATEPVVFSVLRSLQTTPAIGTMKSIFRSSQSFILHHSPFSSNKQPDQSNQNNSNNAGNETNTAEATTALADRLHDIAIVRNAFFNAWKEKGRPIVLGHR